MKKHPDEKKVNQDILINSNVPKLNLIMFGAGRFWSQKCSWYDAEN